MYLTNAFLVILKEIRAWYRNRWVLWSGGRYWKNQGMSNLMKSLKSSIVKGRHEGTPGNAYSPPSQGDKEKEKTPCWLALLYKDAVVRSKGLLCLSKATCRSSEVCQALKKAEHAWGMAGVGTSAAKVVAPQWILTDCGHAEMHSSHGKCCVRNGSRRQ